ncbi:hypothetical protein Q5752_006497 [Cryptotrichosporon argae]
MPFLYPYATTAALTYSSVLHDPRGAHTAALAETTAARARVAVSLAAAAKGDAGGSALAVVEAIQVYLPLLSSLVACLDADELLPKGDLAFTWHLPLSSRSAPAVLPSIHSEHLLLLLTYALALANYAHALLAALALPDDAAHAAAQPSAAAAQRAVDDPAVAATINRAVELLVLAAGVASYAADHVPSAVSAGRKGTAPAELEPEVLRAVSMTMLADAHTVAIRKMLLPFLPHYVFAPAGPPLPAKHPSASLLAKLQLHVADTYNTALSLVAANTGASASAAAVHDAVRPELCRYLRKEGLLAASLARKWMAVNAGENTKGAGIGEAIAWARDARASLGRLEDGRVREKVKAFGIGKSHDKKKEVRRERLGRVERELEDVDAWEAAYVKMNDAVSFQAIPPAAALTLPPGRPILSLKPFEPPTDKFGPAARRAEAQGDKAEGYAGRGQYF